MKKQLFSILVILTFINLAILPASSLDFNDQEDIEDKINIFMKLGHMPSLSACVLKKDKEIWSGSYGYYDLYNKKQASRDTVYMVASVSKTIAALGIMQFYEKGLLDLDDNISNYLPFHIYNPYYPDVNITFRMILSHQSSLNNVDARLFFYFSILNYPNYWLKEFLIPGGLLYKNDVWTNAKPGDIEIYSGSGFALIGYIIEQISNQSFNQYCNENIFQPLEMYNTSFYLSYFDLDRIALPYYYIFGKYIPLPIYEIHNGAVAGLKTTICDLSNFLTIHLNDGKFKDIQMLNKTNIELMQTIQYKNGSDGLSWKFVEFPNGKTYVGHGGEIPGYRSQIWIYPPDKTGIIYSYNQYPGNKFREKYRLMGKLERYAQNQLTLFLFDLANED